MTAGRPEPRSTLPSIGRQLAADPVFLIAAGTVAKESLPQTRFRPQAHSATKGYAFRLQTRPAERGASTGTVSSARWSSFQSAGGGKRPARRCRPELLETRDWLGGTLSPCLAQGVGTHRLWSGVLSSQAASSAGTAADRSAATQSGFLEGLPSW